MLYKKNREKTLSDELFRSPTAEYRGTPFWSWNCKLEEKELLRQIDEFKEMGFGGFHMHCRAGMATDYLGEEFMQLVNSCVKKAKKERMLAWLYDEDRWPSGFAGGIVTRDDAYRARYMVFSPTPPAEDEEVSAMLGRFEVTLTPEGTLASYRLLAKDETTDGEVFWAYVRLQPKTPRYNNESYVDTLNPRAIDRFIEVTHEAYKKAVGREFGKTVPAIFTDEPQFTAKKRLGFATDRMPLCLPWTDDLEETFLKTYGYSLVAQLPELVWDLSGGAPSVVRHAYHAHVAERFAEAFADRCGAWCDKNGIALTGHLMAEHTLASQTKMLGEAMPSYRSFQIPGIDILCSNHEYNTAKQCQSMVRQYGREGMLSELYGVTSWDCDFRTYKHDGDWQAAMGVTVRVPHLAWVSMEGEAKRDYPASIGYQSPWYRQFAHVEDHFARLNTALTRGKPVVRVGVIHPIESFWLHWGPEEQSALASENMERNFVNVNEWLSFGGYDFDYICESTLPEQCKKASAPLAVGKMAYDAIVVPACETLRSSTIERLSAFHRAGGKLIFMGSAPRWMDAVPSEEPSILYESAQHISFDRGELLAALEDVREIELRNATGALSSSMLYQLREDGTDRWLFLCHGKASDKPDLSLHYLLTVRIKGAWKVTLYDTMTGDIRPQAARVKNGKTELQLDNYDYDSFLFRLSPLTDATAGIDSTSKECTVTPIPTASLVPFATVEPNALLLDMAEYALDDEEWQARDELLRVDTRCRKKLGWPENLSGTIAAQPWCIPDEPIRNTLHLRFRIHSEVRVFGAQLALEKPQLCRIVWNGKELSNKTRGYYVDRSIKTVRIPVINKGENVLELSIPFSRRTGAEWCYLLGDFGVRVTGDEAHVVARAEKIGYGDIVPQGLPFYSGALDYHLDVTVPEENDGDELFVRVPQYRGAVIEGILDGEVKGILAYTPYRISLGKVFAGEHRITLRLFVPRTNGFGPVHLADEKLTRRGPNSWRTTGDSFCYEYRLLREGILSHPIVECVK